MLGKKNEFKKKTRFYYKHTENRCRVFCIMCNKIAYSTEQNKYLNNEECLGHNNLQCLNSSCANGFSTTYRNNYIVDNRSLLEENKLPSSSSFRSYMDRYKLQN